MEIRSTIKILLCSIIFCCGIHAAHSQQCTSDSLLLYPSADVAYGDPGFINPNNLPCVQSGTYSELLIPFKTYNQGARLLMLADSSTVPVATIYSMKIESIANLPAGLCWTTVPSNSTIVGSQTGVLIVKGTTSLASGVYPLSVRLSLDITGTGTFTYTGLDALNYKRLLGQVSLRVMDASFNCPPITQ